MSHRQKQKRRLKCQRMFGYNSWFKSSEKRLRYSSDASMTKWEEHASGLHFKQPSHSLPDLIN